MISDSLRGMKLTQHAIRRQLTAMPNDLYCIRLIHHRTRRPLPGQRLWTTPQLLDPSTIKFLRIRNREGFDIYIRPDNWDQNAGYLLVDLDHADYGVLERMRQNGHEPCAVLETSPGHLQAWIHVSVSPLEPFYATAMARLLAREYHGDPASADWRHMGRLAGFTNQKPERRTFYGYAPWVKILYARAGVATAASALLQSVLNETPTARSHAAPRHNLTAASVYPAQAGHIYHGLVCKWRITQRFSHPDWSIVDLWVARQLLSYGLPPAQVEDIIRLASPQFPRRHGNPTDYLHRTVQRACSSFSPTGGSV